MDNDKVIISTFNIIFFGVLIITSIYLYKKNEETKNELINLQNRLPVIKEVPGEESQILKIANEKQDKLQKINEDLMTHNQRLQKEIEIIKSSRVPKLGSFEQLILQN